MNATARRPSPYEPPTLPPRWHRWTAGRNLNIQCPGGHTDSMPGRMGEGWMLVTCQKKIGRNVRCRRLILVVVLPGVERRLEAEVTAEESGALLGLALEDKVRYLLGTLDCSA